jgi:hypothetical protein
MGGKLWIAWGVGGFLPGLVVLRSQAIHNIMHGCMVV